MVDFNLGVQKRTAIGKKNRRLRREGLVPIIVYGSKKEPVNLQAKYRELELTLRDAGGTNLINLNLDGGETFQVLARDVQRDVVKRTILHVDFFRVDSDARITVEVPIVLINESPAVVSRQGLLLTGPNTLTVEMTADNMIDQVVVDLADVPRVGDSIYAKDLKLQAGARIVNEPEEMIVRIAQPSAARREEALAALDRAGDTPEEGEQPGLVGEDEED